MVDPEALRNATEDDVQAALAGSYVEDICGNVEPAALLDFWDRMLDRLIGKRDDRPRDSSAGNG